MGILNKDDLRKLRGGYYTDEYFNRSLSVAVNARCGRDATVVMQFFTKKSGILAGMSEVSAILKELLQTEDPTLNWWRAAEGTRVEPRKPVLYIKGRYSTFGHLETPILGILARRSLVASNTKACVVQAAPKPVVFMAARHDDWRVQEGDGYAALTGGAYAVTTAANGKWKGEEAIGTIPHALLALYNGDTAQATIDFHQTMREILGRSPKTISLVDYTNNCATTAVSVARRMKEAFGRGALYAVRLDTSESMVDNGLKWEANHMGSDGLTGVNPKLVYKVRYALDSYGFPDVKIIVSGGFTPRKIKKFEDLDIPVDGYGVGSAILGHSRCDSVYNGMDFTADIVAVDGKPEAKAGRGYIHNPDILGKRRLIS